MINCRVIVICLLVITFGWDFANCFSTRGKRSSFSPRGKRSESFEISASHGWSKSPPDISEEQHQDVSITEPVNKVRYFFVIFWKGSHAIPL